MSNRWTRAFGVVLFLAACLSVAQSYRSTVAHREYVECQARINNALVARARAADEIDARENEAERTALKALLDTLLDPSLLKQAEQRTPQERQRVEQLFRMFRAAGVELNEAWAAADAARAANPVPAPPAQACR